MISASDIERRALLAYRKSTTRQGVVYREPGVCEAREVGGSAYAVLSNVNGVFAVYLSRAPHRQAGGPEALARGVGFMKKPSYPRVLAVHEAAHAVVAARVGNYVYGVHLRTGGEARRGDFIVDSRKRSIRHAQGLVEVSNFTNPGLHAILMAAGDAGLPPPQREHAVLDIAVSAAGPHAEARQSRKAEVLISLTGGGIYDFRHAEQVASLCPDASAVFDEGWSLGRTMVREYWRDILEVADMIQLNRYTDGDKVHALLDEAPLAD